MQYNFSWENNLKHFISSIIKQKYSLMTQYTFFGQVSPISITQGVWSGELCMKFHNKTRSMTNVGEEEWGDRKNGRSEAGETS